MLLFPGDSTMTLGSPVKPKYLLLLKLLPYFLTTTAFFAWNKQCFAGVWVYRVDTLTFFPLPREQPLQCIFYYLCAVVGGPGQDRHKFGQVFCCNVEADSLVHVADWIRVVCPFRGSNIDSPSHSRAVSLSPILTSRRVSTSLPFTSAFQICSLLFLGGLSLFHLSSP